MTLDAEDRQFLINLFERAMRAHVPPPPQFGQAMPRLTIKEFAAAVQLHEEVVRRKIRTRMIPRDMVFGPPYRISPKALAIFRVTIEDAQTRLRGATQPSAMVTAEDSRDLR